MRDVRAWLLEQPAVQTALARKLVNALNSFTKVAVLDAWGPTLLAHLPMAAKIEVGCHGDAVRTKGVDSCSFMTRVVHLREKERMDAVFYIA